MIRVPTWDLAVVLEGLVEAPFKPLESVAAKNLSYLRTCLSISPQCSREN